MAGLGALDQGEAQLEAQQGKINSAGLSSGWPGSCLPHRSLQLGGLWEVSPQGSDGPEGRPQPPGPCWDANLILLIKVCNSVPNSTPHS